MARYYIKTSTKGYDLYIFGGYYGFTLIIVAEFDWPIFVVFCPVRPNRRPTQEASTFG